MSVDPDTFRSVLGRFASGVTVITLCDNAGRDYGITVTAFASLSLNPPLVLACIDREASIHRLMNASPSSPPPFTVSILAADQEPLARRFAADVPDKFDGIGYSRGANGAALLDDALAYLECQNVRTIEAGDHTIFVGEVEAAVARSGRPLLYYRGGYAQLER